MGILSGKQRETLAEFHDQLFTTHEVYVSDFFPPDGDDDGVPINAPDPPPSMPELKSFDGDDTEPASDEAWEFAGHVGGFAFAAMARSDQTV